MITSLLNKMIIDLKIVHLQKSEYVHDPSVALLLLLKPVTLLLTYY